MAVAENVTAILKDIKVTKKGIAINFEGVKLQGEQLQQLASLIGEVIVLGVDVPQMNLFEDEDVNAVADEGTLEYNEGTELEEGQEVGEGTAESEVAVTVEGGEGQNVEEDLSNITFEEPKEVTNPDSEVTSNGEGGFTPTPLMTNEEVAQQLEI